LFSDLQKDAVIANELERLTRQIVFLQDDNAKLHEDNTQLVNNIDAVNSELAATRADLAACK
jgi:peptidoglycan hydrolase CwlO-like protein